MQLFYLIASILGLFSTTEGFPQGGVVTRTNPAKRSFQSSMSNGQTVTCYWKCPSTTMFGTPPASVKTYQFSSTDTMCRYTYHTKSNDIQQDCVYNTVTGERDDSPGVTGKQAATCPAQAPGPYCGQVTGDNYFKKRIIARMDPRIEKRQVDPKSLKKKL